jgi:hypothetical protein
MRPRARRRFLRAGRSLPPALVLILIAPVLVTCDAEPGVIGPAPSEPIGFSKAHGVWKPGPGDSCSAAVHDGYSVVGPDGLLYPTWHPPVDPSGCTFGHEHGRDPRGSDLFARVGPIPFGHANQVLDTFDPQGMRHEDHVGHKVEWENDVPLQFEDGASAVLDVRCDVLVKLHQGSHSKDAFTNNLHELAYHIDCTDGTELHLTLMAAIGGPGSMVASCDGDRVIHVGPPTPANSPNRGGTRRIPDRACVDAHMLALPGERSNLNAALRESWEANLSIRSANGGGSLAHIDPYFQILLPSRFLDLSKPGLVARPIDVCYELRADGARVNAGECERSTGNGTITGIAWDDARSAFNGVARFVDINSNRITNATGPEVWYTDPFGMGARTEPFPGSIRQFIARIDNSARPSHGPVIGRQRDYGGPGVHAPN